jgi:hypothetical protein
MGIYDKIVNTFATNNPLYEGEKHIILYTDKGFQPASYCGPGTNLITRLKKGDSGKTEVDRSCMRHDIDFTLAENVEQVKNADMKMLENLRKIRARKGDYSFNIGLAETGIENKIRGEMVGIFPAGSFSSKRGAFLSNEDRTLLLKNLKDLEQQGYGGRKKLHRGRALYSNEIEFLLKDIKSFKGVFAKDQLKNIKINKRKPMSCVLNLENSNQNGSHWTLVHYEPKMKFIEYFDSFGISPPKEAIVFMKKFNKKIFYSDNELQKKDSILCGFFCIEYIRDRMTKTPEQIIQSFTKTPSNYNEMKVIDDSF